MSTLMAAKDNGVIWMASDSLRTVNDTCYESPDDKWMKSGRWHVGFAGDARSMNIVDSIIQDTSAKEIWTFINQLCSAFRQDGYEAKEKPNPGPVSLDQQLLVVDNETQTIWAVDQNLGYSDVGYSHAIGSGMHFALGAFNALSDRPMRARVDAAVLSAIDLDPYSGGEVRIHEARVPQEKAA